MPSSRVLENQDAAPYGFIEPRNTLFFISILSAIGLRNAKEIQAWINRSGNRNLYGYDWNDVYEPGFYD
jgi:hypothetical protein